jgi:hypothetical protein
MRRNMISAANRNIVTLQYLPHGFSIFCTASRKTSHPSILKSYFHSRIVCPVAGSREPLAGKFKSASCSPFEPVKTSIMPGWSSGFRDKTKALQPSANRTHVFLSFQSVISGNLSLYIGQIFSHFGFGCILLAISSSY